MTARIEELSAKTVRPGPSSRPPKASVREAAWGFLFISPWIVGLVLLTAIPIIASLLLSFTNYDILHPELIRWVGLDNYAWAASDPATSSAAWFTLKFALVSVPLGMATALGIAILVNHRSSSGRECFGRSSSCPSRSRSWRGVFMWLGFVTGARGMPITCCRTPPRASPRRSAAFRCSALWPPSIRRLVHRQELDTALADPDERLGHRQHDADLPGRVAGDPKRAV